MTEAARLQNDPEFSKTRLSTEGDVMQPFLEDLVVKEALCSGVDLRDYSKHIEDQLKTAEHDAIKDYIHEAENIAVLHNQIQACDGILQHMEEMLGGFQSHLGSISSEIESLQEQSVQMSLKLKNRQAVRGELSQFVDEMAVSEAMINHIMDTAVTEREFLEQLHELQHKINYVKEQSFRDVKSCQDVTDILEKLKCKAIAKIREFLLQKIFQFRKPLANYQIPQNSLLKFRFYYEFLLANERYIAKEIRDEYVDTVGKMYWSYFKTYQGRLAKLQFDDVATKDDVLGTEDTNKGSLLFSAKTTRSRATVFTLGTRNSVLTTDLEAPLIVPHAASQSNQKFPFEALFRSTQFALTDNACREFLFVSDFFMATGQPAHDLFTQVLGKSLELLLKAAHASIDVCYDAIALILCVHIVQRYQILMHKRNVDALDRYWESLLESMLWPRFHYVLQLNIDSVRQVDPEKMGSVDMRPHYIVRRYAEFSAAIVSINESFPDDRVTQLCAQLQREVESLVLRLAHEFKQRKHQLIFFINNYDMMLSVITERTNEDSSESEGFKELLLARQNEYIEEVLSAHFGPLMKFVRECEVLIEQQQTDLLKRYVDKVTSVASKFSAEWKGALEKLNQEIMTSFSNFKNGTNILQSTLTQLVQYYDRFRKVLQHTTFQGCAGQQHLLNMHHIMVEVKKYKPAF